jgi:hypothetical protein
MRQDRSAMARLTSSCSRCKRSAADNDSGAAPVVLAVVLVSKSLDDEALLADMDMTGRMECDVGGDFARDRNKLPKALVPEEPLPLDDDDRPADLCASSLCASLAAALAAAMTSSSSDGTERIAK